MDADAAAVNIAVDVYAIIDVDATNHADPIRSDPADDDMWMYAMQCWLAAASKQICC